MFPVSFCVCVYLPHRRKRKGKKFLKSSNITTLFCFEWLFKCIFPLHHLNKYCKHTQIYCFHLFLTFFILSNMSQGILFDPIIDNVPKIKPHFEAFGVINKIIKKSMQTPQFLVVL